MISLPPPVIDRASIARGTIAACLMLAAPASGVELDLKEYNELVERYRQGLRFSAARALSELPQESARSTAAEFRASAPPDLQLQAAALLHIEIARRFAKGRATHIELAIQHTQAMKDADRRTSFQKRWGLALGYFYYYVLRFSDGEAVLQAAFDLTPGDWELRYALATLREAFAFTRRDPSLFQAAESDYRAMLRERAEEPELHIRLGHVLWRRGRVSESLDELRRNVSAVEGPTRLVAHLVLGEIYDGRDEMEEALLNFRAALAVDPDCQAASAALGMALHRAGERRDALTVTKRLLESKEGASVRDDGWWRYLLSRAVDYDKMFQELQEEVRPLR